MVSALDCKVAGYYVIPSEYLSVGALFSLSNFKSLVWVFLKFSTEIDIWNGWFEIVNGQISLTLNFVSVYCLENKWMVLDKFYIHTSIEQV